MENNEDKEFEDSFEEMLMALKDLPPETVEQIKKNLNAIENNKKPKKANKK